MTTPIESMPPLVRQAKTFQFNFRRGHDFILPLRYKTRVPASDPPVYVEADWPDGVVIVIVVDTDPVTESAPATISGSLAVLRIESSVGDGIPKKKTARVECRLPDSPNVLNRVPINGLTARYDGDVVTP